MRGFGIAQEETGRPSPATSDAAAPTPKIASGTTSAPAASKKRSSCANSRSAASSPTSPAASLHLAIELDGGQHAPKPTLRARK